MHQLVVAAGGDELVVVGHREVVHLLVVGDDGHLRLIAIVCAWSLLLLV